MLTQTRSLWRPRTMRTGGMARRRWSPAVEGLESRELLASTPFVPTAFSALTHRITQLAQIPTTLTLIGPANPVTVGQLIPYQAVVGISSGTTPPTGTVTFAVDGVAQQPAPLNSSGIASVMLPSQTSG